MNDDHPETNVLSPPISLDEPSATDETLSQEVLNMMNVSEEYESNESVEHRLEVVRKLENLLKVFIRRICVKKGAKVFEKFKGKLYTLGLHRMGVHLKGSHIDVLCVTPRIAERHDFFRTFYDILDEEAAVKDLRAAEDAHVPVIRLFFDGIEIHIVFARLPMRPIPDNYDIRDDSLLNDLNKFCIRSMNWCRGTEEILHLVPDVDNFRNCLRVVLHWARSRRIYGNVWGYLSDLSWAILVARTCQLYPRSIVSTLVRRFFSIFSQWNWAHPVLIKQRMERQFVASDPFLGRVDANIMPIICPAYPYSNCTFNVSRSSKETMIKELERGHSMVSDIYDKGISWSKLFEKRTFFTDHQHFIEISASTEHEEHRQKWVSLVESRLRLLVEKLEGMNVNGYVYGKVFLSPGSSVTKWFLGLSLPEGKQPRQLNYPVQRFTSLVIGQARKWGYYYPGMIVTGELKTQNELIEYSRERRYSVFVEIFAVSYFKADRPLSAPNDVPGPSSGENQKSEESFEGDKVSIDDSASTSSPSLDGASVSMAAPKRSS